MTDYKFHRLDRFRTGGTRDKMELSIPLPKTESGKVLRYCPNDECAPRRFLLGRSPENRSISDENHKLVRRNPGENGITCPYCGQDSADDNYTAPEDIKLAHSTITWAVEEQIGDWLEDMAKEFNRSSSKGGFLSLSMAVNRSKKSAPRAWRQDLLRNLTCNVCNRAYGVYAIGFFCPDCGAQNLSTHFQREVELITGQIDIAEEFTDSDKTELAYRILGNAHEDVVTAFETYLKSIFRFVLKSRFDQEKRDDISKKAKNGNPFQNIERSKTLYSIIEVDPYSCLDANEMVFLDINFEKRHIIGHNLGLADEKYVDNSSDGNLGETVTLLADEVERFANMCLRVIKHVESLLPEFLPPVK